MKIKCAKVVYQTAKNGNRYRLKQSFKDLMLSDVNGNELEFPELGDPTEVNKGAKVELNGKKATGEYMMPDGSVLVCKDGVVVEINYPDAKVQAKHHRAGIQAMLRKS